jgi:hypothetical protein
LAVLVRKLPVKLYRDLARLYTGADTVFLCLNRRLDDATESLGARAGDLAVVTAVQQAALCAAPLSYNEYGVSPSTSCSGMWFSHESGCTDGAYFSRYTRRID